jgi:hypothetical protein
MFPYYWLGADAEAIARETEELRILRREAEEDEADG